MKDTLEWQFEYNDDYNDALTRLAKLCNKYKIDYNIKMLNKAYTILTIINSVVASMNKKTHEWLYDKILLNHNNKDINLFSLLSITLNKYDTIGNYESASGIKCRCNVVIDNTLDCFNSLYFVCNRNDDNGRFYRRPSNQIITLKNLKMHKNYYEIKVVHEYCNKETMIKL